MNAGVTTGMRHARSKNLDVIPAFIAGIQYDLALCAKLAKNKSAHNGALSLFGAP